MVSDSHAADGNDSMCLVFQGFVEISPACARALDTAVDVLKKHGHEVFDMCVPRYHSTGRSS